MELNSENLYREYIEKKQNIENVAKIFGVTKDIIKKRLKKFNIHKSRRDIFFQAKTAYDKTMLERYGTTSPIKNEYIKNKIKETCKEKYGVEYVTQSKKIMDKIKQTNLNKYGCEYGLQNEKIKEKSKKTIIRKYGVDNVAKNEIIKKKMRETNLKRYGVKNPGGLIESIKKGEQTKLKKYGNEYTARLREFRIKEVKSAKSNRSKIDGSRFDSSYERDFYDYCLRNGIEVEDKQIPIEYEYEKKKHTTFIDFKVNDKLIECKGGHLLQGIFDYALGVPIEEKLKIYEKYNVILITDKKGINIIKKYPIHLIVEDIENFRKNIDKNNKL